MEWIVGSQLIVVLSLLYYGKGLSFFHSLFIFFIMIFSFIPRHIDPRYEISFFVLLLSVSLIVLFVAIKQGISRRKN